jgi:hypothetical protein
MGLRVELGIRDSMLSVILACAAARPSSVARPRTADYVTDGRSWYVNLVKKAASFTKYGRGMTSSSR